MCRPLDDFVMVDNYFSGGTDRFPDGEAGEPDLPGLNAVVERGEIPCDENGDDVYPPEPEREDHFPEEGKPPNTGEYPVVARPEQQQIAR